MYGLHNLSPSPGARQIARRVGRGLNGGAMCGRGNAGQNSRSGPGPCTGFVGGQTPLWRRFPKLSFQKNTFRPDLVPVSLAHLQHLLVMGRVTPTREGVVEMSDVFNAIGASCYQGAQGIKYITKEENEELCFDYRLILIGGAFTKRVAERVEELGGLPVAVFMNAATFRNHVRRVPQTEPFAPPMHYSSRILYSQPRGYLNPSVSERFRELAPEYHSRFAMVPPMEPIRLPSLKNIVY